LKKIRQKLLDCQGEKEVIFEDCHKKALKGFFLWLLENLKRKSLNDYLMVISLPRFFNIENKKRLLIKCWGFVI